MNANPFLDTPAPVIINATLININEEKKEYICPLSAHIFAEPVVLSNGRTYERECAVRLLQEDNPRDPVTREPVDKNFIKPNWTVKKLITIFLEKNPEFKKEVYNPNPIIQILEKSFNTTIKDLDKTLVELIAKHSDFFKKIEQDDIEQMLHTAYKNKKFATFFVILQRFEISKLKDIASKLMSSPINNDPTSYPNVFYHLAEQDDLPDIFFDIAVDAIGIENCQKLFVQQHTIWPTIFITFWTFKKFIFGKNVLGFLTIEEQKAQITSKIILPCTENHNEDEDESIHYHQYSSLLDCMLKLYPTDDITETLELLKKICQDQIEMLLLKADSSVQSITLLHYIFSLSNIENGIQLAKFCTQQNISRTILNPFKETNINIVSIYYETTLTRIAKSQNQNTTLEFSNLIYYHFVKNQTKAALELLSLLKSDVAQALLGPLNINVHPFQIPVLNYANLIQYLYVTNNSEICDDFLKNDFLTTEQFLVALSAKSTDGSSVFALAILTASPIGILHKILKFLDPKKSSELLLAPSSLQSAEQGLSDNCINLAIKNYQPQNVDILQLMMATLGDRRYELLYNTISQEHIFVTLCKINNSSCTELILNHFDNINLLIQAYIQNIKYNHNIQPSVKNHFTKLLANRCSNILSNTARNIDTSHYLIDFAIHITSFDLLQFYLSLWDHEKIKQCLLITKETQGNNGNHIKTNALTYALLSLNKNSENTKAIIELLISALQDKAINALQVPYTSDKNFIYTLLNNHDESVSIIIIELFTKKEDLREMLKLINSFYYFNATTTKLIRVIERRILAIDSLDKSAELQKIHANCYPAIDQPKIAEIAGASISKCINPLTAFADNVTNKKAKHYDAVYDEIDKTNHNEIDEQIKLPADIPCDSPSIGMK